jgi:hypothetical protein
MLSTVVSVRAKTSRLFVAWSSVTDRVGDVALTWLASSENAARMP